MPYVQAVARIGITMSIRTVDAAQFQNRLRSFDFDVTTDLWARGCRQGTSSASSGVRGRRPAGSRNTAGIRNEGVDAIERVIFARDRDELVAAVKGLDRVLLHHDYVVPPFYSDRTLTARWDRFARPKLPARIRRLGLPDNLVVRCREGHRPERHDDGGSDPLSRIGEEQG